jgi:hypothetical protein
MNEGVFSKPPAHGQIANWLGMAMVERLLDYVQMRRDAFKASGVGYGDGSRIDLNLRRSSKLQKFGELEDELRARAQTALPIMFQQLGTTPFQPQEFELEKGP